MTHICAMCSFETEDEDEAYAHDCMGRPNPTPDPIPTVEELRAGGVQTGDPDAGDPFIEMGEGMRPLPEDTDRDMLIAAYDLVGRVGAVDFVVGYDDEMPAHIQWFARALMPPGDLMSEVKGCTGADAAAERLARKICNGGRCTACGKVMTLSAATPYPATGRLEQICYWNRDDNPKRWERGCIDTHAENQAQIEALEEGR